MHLNNKPEHQRQDILLEHNLNPGRLPLEELAKSIEYKFLQRNFDKYFGHLIHNRLKWIPYTKLEKDEHLKTYNEKHGGTGWFAKKATLKGLRLPSGTYGIEEFDESTLDA